MCECVCVLLLFCYCHVWLCNPTNCSLPGSSVNGISQERIWSGLPFPSTEGLLRPGVEHASPALEGRFFITEPPGKPRALCVCVYTHVCVHMCVCANLLQSCPTLCDPVDYSLPVSSVHGILQVRILKWVAMPSYRDSFQARDQIWVS